MARVKKEKAPIASIPKDEAQRKMSDLGFPCKIVDGVLVFEDDLSPRALGILTNTLMKIGYTASWEAHRRAKA
ncbi:hypothetical protein [Porcincola intestinalis]|uniref:Uncharacterized protein n=1 Tax=Porcincola intestinalis TaxID=2606632 RepID=A0A6L5X4B4_9FIRM|nr:hypothetical protein [Porcincola intestinalis]MSS13674.1 hypothetical protein [Porcincola intestinalis]